MRISDWSSDVCSSDLIKCVIPFCRWYEKCSIAPRIRTVSRKAKEEFVAFLSCKLNIAMVERDYAAFGDMCSERYHIAVAPSISHQIGRASWRERVCQDVSISGVAGKINKKRHTHHMRRREIPKWNTER